MNGSNHLVDSFGRTHNNLRVSVTDRCNIRCFYCMPETPQFMPRSDVLSFEEIERVVRIAVGLGVDKVRLTGGEPLVRRDLPVLVEKLAGIPGLVDLSLTTNGILLPDAARALYEAGLRRINIHLDTLDPEKFQRIVRRPGLENVIEGIHRCRDLGFDPIKLNAVAVRGVTESDVAPLARFGREFDLEVRFIEFMPLDADGNWQRDKVLFASEILDILTNEVGPIKPSPHQDPRAPASEFRFEDGVGRIGIIGSVSRPFCKSCNRLRLTADGKFRNCLFAIEETDVKSLLRADAPDNLIAEVIQKSVQAKWEGHEINAARFVQPPRPMYAIGG